MIPGELMAKPTTSRFRLLILKVGVPLVIVAFTAEGSDCLQEERCLPGIYCPLSDGIQTGFAPQ